MTLHSTNDRPRKDSADSHTFWEASSVHDSAFKIEMARISTDTLKSIKCNTKGSESLTADEELTRMYVVLDAHKKELFSYFAHHSAETAAAVFDSTKHGRRTSNSNCQHVLYRNYVR